MILTKDNSSSNNLLGYFFILFPPLSFLYYAHTLPQFFCVMAGLIIGISFSISCFSYMKYKTILAIHCSLCLSGFFLTYHNTGTPLIFIGLLLCAMGFSGQVYSVFIGQILSFDNKTSAIDSIEKAFLVSASIISSIGFFVLINNLPFSFSLVVFLVLFFCALISIQTPRLEPFIYLTTENKRHKHNRVKAMIFFAIISSTTCTILTMAAKNFPIKDNSSFLFYFLLGLVLGPLITNLFIRVKGIYSGCILLIFLAESSLLFVTFYKNIFLLPALGFFCIGIILTSIIYLCPLLTYYLLGPRAYYHKLGSCLFSALCGGFLILPLSFLDESTLLSTEITMTTIGMLLISFFAVFSAWSHRFVLLK